jgi:hypothetical protein
MGNATAKEISKVTDGSGVKKNNQGRQEEKAPSLARGCLINTVFPACIVIGLLVAYKGAFGNLDSIYFPIGLGILGIGSAVIWHEWR